MAFEAQRAGERIVCGEESPHALREVARPTIGKVKSTWRRQT